MKRFDLNLLRVIVALDQTRHVGRAAEMLDMSQSGFSSALMRLRRELGDELFVRTGSGMRPTPRAIALVESARLAMQQVEQGVLGPETFDPTHSEVVFRLSMSDIAEIVYVPRLIRGLAALAPHTSVQVVSSSLASLREPLAGGEVDLAIGYFPELERDAYFRQPLSSHTYACVVRRGHPVLAEGLDRAAYQTLGHAVVASPARSNAMLERAIERMRIKRRIILSSPNHLSLPATIACTDLIATLPLGVANDFMHSGDLVVVPLPFRSPTFTNYQYWHRRTNKEPAFKWLRAQIKTLFGRDSDH
jgi:DNA-binding transcriptional LysR family regulator